MELILNPLLAAEIAKEVKPGVHDAAEAVADDARAHCPVDTGELLDSIEVVDTDDGSQVIVGTDHWIYPEFGTVNMAAEPFMRPAIDDVGLQR